MRKFVTALAAAALLTTATVRVTYACDGHDNKGEKQDKPLPKHMASATFKVEGMDCSGCADKLKAGLAKREGIVEVSVAVAEHRVTVKYDKEKLDVAKIAKLLTDLGYKATAEA